jgi:cytochrome c biogenesis protein CcmG/thiol:disulfide interchange protein DsbE
MASSPQKSRIVQRNGRLPLALLAVLAVLLPAGCGTDDSDLDPGNAADAPDYTQMVDAAPPKLASIYDAEGGQLRGEGLADYERQIAELEGYPIVVNKWASWCGPCREEFPYFQQEAARRGDEVAFLGLNSDDSDDAATTFLRDHPVPYVSVSDPDKEIANSLATVNFPATIFYNADGEKVFVHEGLYTSSADLAADIDRYAVDG